ncbi:hypothetical protein NQ315_007568 [Exocentrus adspersus]|uniref:Transposase n=1 Tax=Exocentrus adspersus TaxID=1586481 RepID=A0AAV8W7B4_9CUCU|nr:hypothetical protein NQ315_007568 [Exocentrus adspersus]
MKGDDYQNRCHCLNCFHYRVHAFSLSGSSTLKKTFNQSVRFLNHFCAIGIKRLIKDTLGPKMRLKT